MDAHLRAQTYLMLRLLACFPLALVPSLGATAAEIQIPKMQIHLPPCNAGPEIYAAVARRRDQGRAMPTQLRKAIEGPSGSTAHLSHIQVDLHNRLVREIYAHPDWTPDEVAHRWLIRCKKNMEDPKKHLPSGVVVETLE